MSFQHFYKFCLYICYIIYFMADKQKRVSKLLTRVPKDVLQIVTAHQELKKSGCGCRFGFEQALYELIRNAYSVPLPHARPAKTPAMPAVQ